MFSLYSTLDSYFVRILRDIVQWSQVISMFLHYLFILYETINFKFFLDFQRDKLATI